MAVAAVFEFPKEAIAAYDRNLELHGDVLRDQPARRCHVCFETKNGFMVVDVWESLEAFEEFGQRLDDEVAADFPFSSDLHLHQVHNFI
jgi:hypothetical protein